MQKPTDMFDRDREWELLGRFIEDERQGLWGSGAAVSRAQDLPAIEEYPHRLSLLRTDSPERHYRQRGIA